MGIFDDYDYVERNYGWDLGIEEDEKDEECFEEGNANLPPKKGKKKNLPLNKKNNFLNPNQNKKDTQI